MSSHDASFQRWTFLIQGGLTGATLSPRMRPREFPEDWSRGGDTTTQQVPTFGKIKVSERSVTHAT
jgi:hypothetical protein